MLGNPLHVYGGVYIEPGAAGGVLLLDLITGLTTAQNLISQALTATATLYMTLQPKVKVFWLRSITMAYVDDANVNDLAALYLLEGPEADDGLQDQKARWRDTDGIAEGLWTPVTVDYVPFVLDAAAKLFLLSTWSTAVVNNDDVDDRFYLRVDGFGYHRVP